MSSKYKYTAEYEINASVKMIYPYLSTANGLAEWFAEEVKMLKDKTLDIVWDGESHPARLVSARTNSHVKYVFSPLNQADEEDPSFLEFKLVHSEMTDTAFLKVIDYSEMDNEKDLRELWENLIFSLRELLGAGGNE
ncbi:MAG: ATPase [Cytophagales bacterium]|nr:MAG: ATPase [Cytophagales bacterium]